MPFENMKNKTITIVGCDRVNDTTEQVFHFGESTAN